MQDHPKYKFQNDLLLDAKQNIIKEILHGCKPNFIDCSIITYHNIPLKFYFTSKEQKEHIEKLIPLEWITSIQAPEVKNIYCYHPQNFYNNDLVWDDEQSPECYIYSIDKNEAAIQRDFAGVSMNDGDAHLVYQTGDDDGFFNALRWYLPRKLLFQDQIILHSSCVIGRDQQAYFFLGPSGAGKSTIASLSEERLLLGDDMNVLSKDQGQFWAQAGAFGGRSSPKTIIWKKYPIGGFFWLKKGTTVNCRKVSLSQSALKIVVSCSHLFWKDKHDPRIEQKVLNLATEISQRYPICELEFNLTKEFWEHVEKK